MLVNKHILLIDDDESICAVVEILVEIETNWKITIAYSGRDGIRKAISQHPDMILLDVNMPDINGIETLQNLKLNQDTKAIPVILFTSETKILEKLEEKLENRKLDVKGILSKTAILKGFANEIERIINRENLLSHLPPGGLGVGNPQ